MKTTVLEILKKRKITGEEDILNFLHGKRLEVHKTTSGHNYGRIGDTFVVDTKTPRDNGRVPYASATNGTALTPNGNSISWNEALMDDSLDAAYFKQLIADKTAVIDKAKAELETAKQDQALFETLNVDSIEGTSFNAYKIVTTVRGSKEEDVTKLIKTVTDIYSQ